MPRRFLKADIIPLRRTWPPRLEFAVAIEMKHREFSRGVGKVEFGLGSSEVGHNKFLCAGSLLRSVVGAQPNSAIGIGHLNFRHPFPPFSLSDSIEQTRLQ
jgi:hypothetical protein